MSWKLCIASSFALITLFGCAGGTPMMHPAHPLPSDGMSAGTGLSARFIGGKAKEAISAQDSAAEGSVGPGTAIHAALSPGLAPWAALRVGLGQDWEGGLTYTGRSARADLRHAWVSENTALSIGVGGSALLSQQASRTSYASVGGVDTGATTGWGCDIPVLVGIRSSTRLTEFWLGVRGGYENSSTQLGVPDTPPADDLTAPGTTHDAGVQANQWRLAAVAGMTFGRSPVWLVVETQLAHHWLEGHFDSADGEQKVLSTRAISLTPASSLKFEF